jgi:hypothetical protein
MDSKDDDDRDKSCPVCLEDFSNRQTALTRPESSSSSSSSAGISKRRRRRTAAVNPGGERELIAVAFPCGHRTCQTCFARCESCPICRTGKDGSSHSERREVEEREARTANPSSFMRVVTFEGSREHPFAGLHIAVFGGVPSPLRTMLPDAIAQHLALELGPEGRSLLRARRGERPHVHPSQNHHHHHH